MPTSAWCRRSSRHNGFTLLEMVVVLAIVGMLAAVVLPRLSNALAGVTNRARIDGLVTDLDLLAYRAFALGVAVELSAASAAQKLPDGEPVLALPEGWQLEVPKPIRFSLTGFCAGGEILLRSPDGATHKVRLTAPACHAALADSPS